MLSEFTYKPHQRVHIPDLGFWVPHIRHHLFMPKNLLPSHAPGLLTALAFG